MDINHWVKKSQEFGDTLQDSIKNFSVLNNIKYEDALKMYEDKSKPKIISFPVEDKELSTDEIMDIIYGFVKLAIQNAKNEVINKYEHKLKILTDNMSANK